MKQIITLGKGKYITVDVYGNSHETRLGSIAICLLALLLATISGSALLGVDLTKINPQPTQVQPALKP